MDRCPKRESPATTAGSRRKPWQPRWWRWSSFHRNTNRALIWTISGSCWPPVARTAPSRCIWRRPNAGFFPTLIHSAFIGNTASTTGRPDAAILDAQLYQYNQYLAVNIRESRLDPARRGQQAAYQPSGNGTSGHACWLSLAAFGGRLSVWGWAKNCSCGAGSIAIFTASSIRSYSASLIALSRFPGAQGVKTVLFPD